jgi:hypothetical protein
MVLYRGFGVKLVLRRWQALMYRLPLSGLILFSVALLMAADASWNTKPISNWTEDDARQILTKSPWAKSSIAGLSRLQSEDERREGGNMGQPHGVGYDGINNGKRPMPNLQSIYGGPGGNVRRTGDTKSLPVKLVWESAMPVHAAELKSHDIEPPTLSEEGYSIAVYGIPFAEVKGDPKKAGEPMKNLAMLRREGKKDVRPSSVEVFQRDNDVVVVYIFPLSAEITRKDQRVDFYAQIGRLNVAQAFFPEEMIFQSKLEL